MIQVEIIKKDNYLSLRDAINAYLTDHPNALIRNIVIQPRGNSDKELCYAVLVEVTD